MEKRYPLSNPFNDFPPKIILLHIIIFFFIPYSWKDNSSWYVFYNAYFPNFWVKKINIKWNRVFAVSCKLMELLINNRKCVCLKLEIRIEDSYFYATYFSLDRAGSKFSVISKLKFTSVSLSIFYQLNYYYKFFSSFNVLYSS